MMMINELMQCLCQIENCQNFILPCFTLIVRGKKDTKIVARIIYPHLYGHMRVSAHAQKVVRMTPDLADL